MWHVIFLFEDWFGVLFDISPMLSLFFPIEIFKESFGPVYKNEDLYSDSVPADIGSS